MSFPRYPKYKHSGVELLGEVPEHWDLKRFKLIFKEREERSTSGEEVLLSVSAYTGVSPRSEVIADGDHLSRADSLEGYKVCYKNDLVINIMLAWNRGLGFSTYDGIVSPAYCVFFVIDSSDPNFLNYLVRSNEYTLYFKAFSAGVIDSRLRIYPETFGRLFCGVPPLPDQIKIAEFLDGETSKIDDLVSEQQQLIDLLKEKHQAVIFHAVTKGLDPSVSMKASGVEWLGYVPEHWSVKRVKYLTEILRGKFTHRPRHDPAMYDGPYPFIQTGQINQANRFVDEHKQTLSEAGFKQSKQFPRGTLVMTITGAGTANVAILDFEACFPDSIIGFVPRKDMSIDYLYSLFTAMRQPLLETSVTNTQPNLNIDRIGALLTVQPPPNEQDDIILHINEVSASYETLIAEAQRAIDLLQERRTALISAAVTGQIDVRKS